MATTTSTGRDRARDHVQRARAQADQTRRGLRSLLADSAYATVGAGEAAVELVKSIDRIRVEAPKQVRTLGQEAPERLRSLRDQGTASVRTLRDQAGQEFDSLAQRGRELVRSISTSPATREAADQARTARSRVKAARTSVTRAAEDTVQAVEEAAGTVASKTEPTARREVVVGGDRPAATNGGGDEQAVEVRATAARKPRDTRSYEERSVEELRERARELDIEGRASMSKEELIAVLRSSR